MNKDSFTKNDEQRDVNRSDVASSDDQSVRAAEKNGRQTSSSSSSPISGGTRKRGNESRRNRQGASMMDRDGEGMSMDRVAEVSRNLGEQIEIQLQERPYIVLGAAAGLGFIAGSLLGSRLGQMAIAIAGGYLAHNLMGASGGDVQRFVREGIDKVAGDRGSEF